MDSGMTNSESDSLRSLQDSPREIADEILDLVTLLGVLLAGDGADTCLPGIYRINGLIFERATILREALQCGLSGSWRRGFASG
jgi:hypothetical protein